MSLEIRDKRLACRCHCCVSGISGRSLSRKLSSLSILTDWTGGVCLIGAELTRGCGPKVTGPAGGCSPASEHKRPFRQQRTAFFFQADGEGGDVFYRLVAFDE